MDLHVLLYSGRMARKRVAVRRGDQFQKKIALNFPLNFHIFQGPWSWFNFFRSVIFVEGDQPYIGWVQLNFCTSAIFKSDLIFLQLPLLDWANFSSSMFHFRLPAFLGKKCIYAFYIFSKWKICCHNLFDIWCLQFGEKLCQLWGKTNKRNPWYVVNI